MTSPEFVAFDLETTGLSPKTDRIIEIGAVRFDAEMRPIAHLDLFVDPGTSIPLAVQRLTGIADADVRGAPSPEEAMAQFADFCDGAALVAHGAEFDAAYCVALLPWAFRSRTVYDTLELARILVPTAPSHSLPLLSAQLHIEHLRPHRADSDAAATHALFAHLTGVAARLPATLLARIRRVLTGVEAPLADFFRSVVLGEGVHGIPDIPHRAALTTAGRTPMPRPQPTESAAPAADLTGDDERPLGDAAAALLGSAGPLAGQPQYEYREAQIEMARAVGQTLERGGCLLVEAGTGVGKSLAYLVPLALWTQRTGRRAVVATHTTTLQEQLAEHDLAQVDAILPTPVRHALLKGRQHYISLRRWERYLATTVRTHRGGVDIDALRFKLKVLCWLAQTHTGDRAELRLAGEEEPLWANVRSETDDCLGSACANWRDVSCHMVAARRAAAVADIVVTNHALLLADAERQGQVLAPYQALVVDEAHHLEESATRQLGRRLRAINVMNVIDRLDGPDTPAAEGEVPAALARCREAVQRIFGDVKGFVAATMGTDQSSNAVLGLREEVRALHGFEVLQRAARHALRTLQEGARTLREARGTAPLQAALLPQPDRVDDELDLAAAALEEAAATIDAVVCTPRQGHVAWLEVRAEQAELHEAPVSVSELLEERILRPLDAAVLTSATLSVGGSFDFIRERTGAGAGAHAIDLPSPYDYLAQALCVLSPDIPPYDEPAYDEVLAELCADIGLRLGGRTLVLFTGYQPLRRVHALLRPRLEPAGIVALGQGIDGTRRQILASFLQSSRTVLLGTSTFWEGIDIPGDALSCVVIAKLPFPVPTDPLLQARAAGLDDAFLQLALPIAVLRLKQGFGRLIRRSDDRGAVVLCDSRLATREYGTAFVEALPRATIIRESRHATPAIVADFVHHGVVPSTAERPGLVRAGSDDDWYDMEPA